VSEDKTTVNIRILGNEFLVSCGQGEVDDLMESARELNQRMQLAHDSGTVIGLDRIAVLAALNLTHENMRLQRQLDAAVLDGQDKVVDLTQRVRQAIDDATALRPDR